MATALNVWKNPRPGTLAEQIAVDENAPAPSAPWERMTHAAFAAWIAAQSEVPEKVTRRQLLIALFRAAGVKESDILAQLGQIENAAARYEAETEFKHATEFARAHPLVAQLAASLALTSAQVDEMFRTAATL